MIKALRRRHRQIWMAWAVLLPVAIVSAWLVIPDQSPVKLLQANVNIPLPVIKGSARSANYDIYIRSNQENTQWQLEWFNKKVLMVPTAVIYKDNQLIGRIEARGNYIFPLAKDPLKTGSPKLVLYDFIHQQTIDSIIIQP